MYKRGQVTIFLIVGIVVLAVFTGMIYVAKYAQKASLGRESAGSSIAVKNAVTSFVESCLTTTVKQGISFISKQGGFHTLPKNNIILRGEKRPYYFYSEENLMPSPQVIQEQLSAYIKENVSACLDDFKIFKEEGYTIATPSEMEVTSRFLEKKVAINLHYPLQVIKGPSEITLDEFSISFSYDFAAKIHLIQEFMRTQQQNTDWFPIGSLHELAEEEGFTFEMIYQNTSTLGLNFLFNDSFYYQPLIYSFVLAYPTAEEQPAPVIIADFTPLEDFTSDGEEVEEIIVRQGEILVYYVTLISGKEVQFYDYTDWFDINPVTGRIEWDTALVEPGNYSIPIQAIDKFNQSDLKILEIVVV